MALRARISYCYWGLIAAVTVFPLHSIVFKFWMARVELYLAEARVLLGLPTPALSGEALCLPVLLLILCMSLSTR